MFSIRTMITLGKGAGARRGYKGALGTGHQVCSAHENSLAKQVGIVRLFYIKQNLPKKKKNHLAAVNKEKWYFSGTMNML